MERNLRKERIGVVVSNKMDKTIIVAVETKKEHPLYGKFIKQTTKFVAQDDKNECSEEIPCALWKPVLSARPRGGD